MDALLAGHDGAGIAAVAGAAIASSRVTLPPAARVAMPSPMLPEALAANPLAELFSVCEFSPIGAALNLVEQYIDPPTAH